MSKNQPAASFRNSVWRLLLECSWLWIASLLVASGVWEAPVPVRIAGWMIAIGGPLALVAVLTSSIRVAGDRVVVKDLRGTEVYVRGESSLRVRSYATGPVGSFKVLEFVAPGTKTKGFPTAFMSRDARHRAIHSVREALRPSDVEPETVDD